MNAKEAMIRTGKNLEEIRLEKNFSVPTLAVLSGVDEEMIGSIERGQCDFRLSVIFELAAALNVDFRRIIVDTVLYRS